MPGVASVQQQYEQGDVLFYGSLTVQVQMQPDSTDGETLAVIGSAYLGVSTTLSRDSVDLVVRRLDTEILVHTRDPHADFDEVLDVARFALDAPRPGERTRADMVANADEDFGDFVSEVRLSLGPNSSEGDIEPRLDDLAAAGGLPDDTDIWVLAADGAGVGGSRGLPTDDDLALWHELSSVPAPGEIKVEFGPYQLYSDLDDFGFAYVQLSAKPAPTKAQLEPMKTAHMALLAKRSVKYVYNVTVNGEGRIWLARPPLGSGSD